MNAKEEARLVALARAGDKQAFAALVTKYRDRLFDIASGVCARMPSEAEDVAQETFIAAFRNIGTFRANATFGTWLYRIAANNCWQHMRRAKAHPQQDLPDENHRGHPAASNEGALKNELAKVVNHALSELPAQQRMAVMLCDIEGLPDAEAAGRLGVSLPALKARLHRARGSLRTRLYSYAK